MSENDTNEATEQPQEGEHQEQAEGHGHHQLHQTDAALCAPRSDHGCPPISAETVSEALPASASMRSSDQLNVTVAR